MSEDADAGKQFVVLINEEEQYSLWPRGKEIPAGWRAAGKEGSKSECCDYVDTVWTDMRPLSLRRRMDGAGKEH